ncbi:hypothetical protein ACYJ1Y_08955 [Natrialbaceae archaeon A-gly3]
MGSDAPADGNTEGGDHPIEVEGVVNRRDDRRITVALEISVHRD